MDCSGTEKIALTLKSWTKGLDHSEKHISVFNHVRDIPYALIPELMNPYTGPQDMLACQKGSCSPKHFLLGKMFQLLNIPVRYVSFVFSWKDQALTWPAGLKRKAAKLPPDYHLACKAYIRGQWRLLDATWDTPLKAAGAEVNDFWDGKSDTVNAVKPLERIMHDNAEARMRYVFSRESLFSEENNLAREKFGLALNDWLEKIRAHKYV